MRKLKLLLAACALFVGGVNSANAKTDVTSSYLTDASLTDESTNWALVNGANNHNWNNDYKYHESWHNTFSISQTASLPNGYYQISIQAVNSVIPSSNVILTATSGENTASAYVRHSSAGSFAEISQWLSGNPLACRIYATVKVENGSLAVSFSQPNDTEWLVYGNMKLYSLTETEYKNAVALQTAVESNTNGWSAGWVNGGNQYRFGRERFNETAYESGKIIYKTLNDLPKGKYDVTVMAKANVAWRDAATGDNIAEVYANDGKYSLTVNAETGFEPTSAFNYTIQNALVSDGSLEVGIRNIATGGNWYVISLVDLQLTEPYISVHATEIPAATATALTADTWYKFTAVSTDNYSFSATTIGDIICTSTDQLSNEATGTAATATMALTSGTTYYIKSSSAQTLTIIPQTFTYSVGAATPSVADAGYTQSPTFTLTFADATTDDPSGNLSILDASKITVNSAQASASITGNVLTITLTDAIAAATDFAISVAAGAVGYNAENANAATALTIHTPAVLDGNYYLYDANSAKFLSRGKNYGSRAVVDLYGIPFNLTTDATNTSTIQFVDWTTVYLFKTGNTIYTDNASTGWKFVKSGDKYYLKTADDTNFAYVTGENIVDPTDAEASATLWTLKSKAERDAIVNAYPAANKTNVIIAASLTSETDAAGFEDYLAANYAAEDKTASVGTAKFTGSAGSWTWTLTSNNTANASYGTDWTEAFETGGTWSQTISGLTPGIYKVTVNGFERKAGYALCNTLGAEGYEPVTAYFKANDEQLPLKSWYSDKEGTNDPNNTSQAATAFNNDKYKNTIYTYVDASGELTLTIGKQDKASGSWVLFNNVTLTFYNNSLTDDQKTAILAEATTEMAKPMKPSLYQALKSAESTFNDNKTMANYNALRTAIDNTATSVASYAAMNTNYLEPITALLASSNIIDQTTSAYTDYVAYKAKYDNYTNAETADIENATANALTLYQGTGARYTNIGNILMTTGWQIGGTDALTDGSGFYANTWSTESAGTAPAADFARPFYEMWVSSGSISGATLTRTITGLTANAVYQVTANVRVQYTSKKDASITMQAGDGEAVDVTIGSKIGDTDRYIGSYTAQGRADGSGNLTITFTVDNESGISWLSFRDVNYAEAVAENVTISENADYTPAAKYADVTLTRNIKADTWNTFVVPFDISNSELTAAFGADVAIAEYSETADGDNSTVNFTKMTTPAVKANVPVLLKTSTAGTSYVFAGRFIATSDAKVAGTNFDFTGTYDASTTIAAGDWFINADKLYKSTGATTIKGTRAYIKAKAAGARITNLTIDGNDATAIESLKVDNANGKIYNLQGQEVKKGQKGVFIQNGKKMVVK